MSDETTVLLVKGSPLPGGLQAQLEAKGVFVEEASPSHLEASVVAVAPDMILVFGVEVLSTIVPKLASVGGGVPIVVVAERQAHRELRQTYKEALATIIPSDLPHAALSHRIATLSRRASKGESLVQTMSLAPPKADAKAPATSSDKTPAAPRDKAPAALPDMPTVSRGKAASPPATAATKGGLGKTTPTAKTGLGSTATLQKRHGSSARVGPEKSFAPGNLAEPKLSAKSPPATPEPLGTGKKATPLAAVGQSKSQAALARPAALPESPEPAAPPAPPESGPKSSTAALDSTDEYPTAAFKLPAEVQQKARRDSIPPATVRRPPSDEDLGRLSDSELIAQELDARQRLSSGGDEPVRPPTREDIERAAEADQRARYHRRSHATASAVRLVLCDDDVTRADALASELREHGLDVMLLSPEHSQVRWPRLRRFAPHGLLVDERSLSKGGRQIVSAFRRDPFLKYVPLVVVPFQRIYRETEARANLAPVFPLLSPLGREELGLLEQLAKKEEIVVELSQVLPSRLVEVLAENEATCVLTTSGQGRRLTWPIAAGKAGKAELSEGVGSQGSSLKPEDALRFLLDQDEAQVQVLLRPQIHLTAAEAIGPLLDRVTASIEPPLQHSVAPRHSLEPEVRPTLLGVAPPPGVPTGSGVPTGIGPENLPTVPAPSLSDAEEHPEVATALAAVRASSAHQRTVVVQRSWVSASLERAVRWRDLCQRWLLEKRRTWPPALFWGALAAPVVVLLVLLLLVVFSGDAEADAVAEASAPTPAAAAPAPQAAAQSPTTAAASPLDRFRVADDAPARSCDEVLGVAPSAVTGDASAYWKVARQALMQGNVERAHEMMCRAVAREPASPAAEGLAAFYLGKRATGLAERYVQGVLAIDPGRRTALELQSDVKNQQGLVEEAKRILLATLRLEATDDVRLAAVSRKFGAEADLAIKSGDYPLAERLLRRAVVLSPENDQATLRLAEVFLRAGLRDAAKLWAEVLLAGPSRHAEAQLVLGDVARLNGDTQAARRHYEQVPADSAQAARAQNQLKTLQ